MRRLTLLALLGLALGLGGCGFPRTPNDGQIHLGGGISVTRHAPQVHVEICPPYCGPGSR